MKNIYDIENTLVMQRYMKRFFVFCLIRQPSLIKYVFPHIFSLFAYTFKLNDKATYVEKYWSFLKDIDKNARIEAFAKLNGMKRYHMLDQNGVYIAYAPRVFVKTLLPGKTIFCLEDIVTSKGDLYHLLKEHNISKFALVELTDKSLRASAQKQFYLKKGKLLEKSPKTTAMKTLQLLGILLLLSFFITVFVLALTPSDWRLGLQLIFNPLTVLVNLIPVFFLMLILYGIVNNVRGSFVITAVLFIILVEINRFKIAFRDDPFVFLDIKYASEAAQMTSSYTLYIDKMTMLILLVFFSIVILLGFSKIRKSTSILLRLSFIALPIFCYPLLYDDVYLNTTIYDKLWNDEFGNMWKSANQYTSRGFTYSFLRSFNEGELGEPDGYDQQVAMDVLQEYEEIDMDSTQKVNIISIMLEAYNDVSMISPTATIDASVYQNMHNIQRNSYSGFLYTDIFAGGTIASERSYLTGFSSLGDFRFPTNTYVSYFKQQGYYTEAMHPCYGWFYNRKNVNEIGLGFDNFDYQENKYGDMIEGGEVDDTFFGFLTDDDFFNEIILGYEKNKERDMPYFNFSVTYQNHGPYSNEAQGNEEYLKWEESYDENSYHIVNNYLANVKATDEAIGSLYDYINSQEEPIVLVLYGDHNPFLGEGNSGFDLLDINLDLGTVEGGQNYYQTRYVITANQAAKKALNTDFKGVGNTISPMFLMNEVFEVANLNIGTAYSQYLRDFKQTIDVINPLYIKKDDAFVLKDVYEDDGTLEEFYNIQYYVQNDTSLGR